MKEVENVEEEKCSRDMLLRGRFSKHVSPTNTTRLMQI
jgi:hypothetical protein